MNYKISLSYVGQNFHGWAEQPNFRTVQGTVKKALEDLFKLNNITINASGRTDANVHAIEQIINIKHKALNLSSNQLQLALKSKLSSDIRINWVETVSDSFHARYDCKNKTYYYLINTKPIFDLFNQYYIYQYNNQLNIEKMQQAANLLVGTHDFLSFSTSELNQTIRTINYIELSWLQENELMIIKVNGNGFLRNMVRMIVGCLIKYSENKIDLEFIKDCLENPKKGKIQFKAPGCGLYLYNVKY